jgi:DNA repair photolyase
MIGITECGDAGLDFSWVEQMPTMDFAILITKNVNDKFIKEVVKVKEKVIVHATITGMGGTVVEPRVPPVSISIGQLKRLINAGFPASQIVLRVDPIIPTPKGIRTATSVLDAAEGLGIKRCRVK